MNFDLLIKIQDNFNHIYQQMMAKGIQRYKRHKILITKVINSYAKHEFEMEEEAE